MLSAAWKIRAGFYKHKFQLPAQFYRSLLNFD